ncbi:MAG: ferritin-like domain-containing protein [Burkholderiaceae bacterium]
MTVRELRQGALAALRVGDPREKVAAVHALAMAAPAPDPEVELATPSDIPGRPPTPRLVRPSELAARPAATQAGRAALLHSIAHIEFNAINLALDAIWRFPGMPAAYYLDWLGVADEEASHFTLVCGRLLAYACSYGDFPAHNGLWEMAEKTADDVLARMALVPRTLEARGLDASPSVRAKLAGAGDDASAQVIDVILRDEIGHVAIGNRWFRLLCGMRGLDPHRAYVDLSIRYSAPRLHGPFNIAARRAAGFDDEELRALDPGFGLPSD